MVKVVFQLAKSDLHDHATESLWAEPLGEGRAQLKNVPYYVYRISYDDVVNINCREDPCAFQSVAERGGHSTYRVFLREGVSDDRFEKFWSRLRALGCTYERGTDILFAVDIPPEA